MLEAIEKLQKKHELLQRRAERMLMDMKELTRTKRAGECDRDDEPGHDEECSIAEHAQNVQVRRKQTICGI